MFFNPLFLQAINTGETASVAKNMKPGGTQYLFSDIIKVCINKESVKNSQASLQIPGQEASETGGAAIALQNMTSGLSIKEIVEFLSGNKISGNTPGTVSADGLNAGTTADISGTNAGDIALFKLGSSGLTGIRLVSNETQSAPVPGARITTAKQSKPKSETSTGTELPDNAKINGLESIIAGAYNPLIPGLESIQTSQAGNYVTAELNIDDLRELLNQIVSDTDLSSKIKIEVITADGKTIGLEELTGDMLAQLPAGQNVWNGKAGLAENLSSAGNTVPAPITTNVASAVVDEAAETGQTVESGKYVNVTAADVPAISSENEESLSSGPAALQAVKTGQSAEAASMKAASTGQNETRELKNTLQPDTSEPVAGSQTAEKSTGSNVPLQNNAKNAAGKPSDNGQQFISIKNMMEKAAESAMQGGTIQIKNSKGDTVQIHVQTDMNPSVQRPAETYKGLEKTIGDFRVSNQQVFASASGTIQINESADIAGKSKPDAGPLSAALNSKATGIQSADVYPGAQEVNPASQQTGTTKADQANTKPAEAAGPVNLSGTGSEPVQLIKKDGPAPEAAADSVKNSEGGNVQDLPAAKNIPPDGAAQLKDSSAVREANVVQDGNVLQDHNVTEEKSLPEETVVQKGLNGSAEDDIRLKYKHNSGKPETDKAVSADKDNLPGTRNRAAERPEKQTAENISGSSTEQKQQFEDFRSISGKIREFHENSVKLRDSGNIQIEGNAQTVKSNRKAGSEESKPESADKHVSGTENRQAAVQEKSNNDNSGEKYSSGKQSSENHTADNSSAEKTQIKETRAPEGSTVHNTQETSTKSGEVHIKEKQSVLHGSVPDKTVKAIEVIKEITKFMQHGDRSQMVLKIDPENLGLVKIALETVDSMLNASIEVENEAAKKLVETSLPQLHASLNQSGVHLNSLNISLADYGQKDEAQQKGGQKKKQQLFSETISEEDNTQPAEKQMGYNTYEFLA